MNIKEKTKQKMKTECTRKGAFVPPFLFSACQCVFASINSFTFLEPAAPSGIR